MKMRYEKAIFKIQRSISTTPDTEGERVLIYNEDRSLMWQQPMTAEFNELFPRGELKIFMHGRYRLSDRKILLDRRASMRDW